VGAIFACVKTLLSTTQLQGMTLADIARTVDEINSSINDRKTRLAPQIKKLRQMRQEFAVSGCLISLKYDINSMV
jgi:hypothetical protein